MNKKYLLLFLAGLLPACTSGGAARVEPASISVYSANRGCEVERPDAPGMAAKFKPESNRNELRRPGAINLDCFQFPGGSGQGSAYKDAVAKIEDRNRLANALIAQSDSICTIEKSLMLERQAEVNGWLSIASTGLATAATIVTGELASNILSGTGALASASRDHVNTHVYRNQIIQTVTTAIDSERSAALVELEKKFKLKVSEYPIDQAIREVNAYHGMCSFGFGMQKVMEAVEKQEELKQQLRISAIEGELIRLSQPGIKSEQDVPEIKAALNAELVKLKTGVSLPTTPQQADPPVGGGTPDPEAEGGDTDDDNPD